MYLNNVISRNNKITMVKLLTPFDKTLLNVLDQMNIIKCNGKIKNRLFHKMEEIL